MRFIRTAQQHPGGFDDIWLLGDVFGHSEQSTGTENLTQPILDTLMIYLHKTTAAVQGNWEYWLAHPERDHTAKDQGKYTGQLEQRRELLAKGNNRRPLEQLTRDTVLLMPDPRAPEFTLFHGCSFASHCSSDYQPQPCECYLFPRDLNIVTRGLFGDPEHLSTPHFLFGHTHTPGYFIHSRSAMLTMWQYLTPELQGRPIPYGNPRQRFGINPGSAGIKGKNTPRTAILLDTNEKTFTYLTDEERDDYE